MGYQENHKVNAFVNNAKKWGNEYHLLVEIARSTGLAEEFKWGKPCYTYEDSNVFLIHGFKEYSAFLFFKGALMKDDANILIKQTENVQAARQLRFENLQQIKSQENLIKDYLIQAIEIEKSGAKIEFKKTNEFETPDELSDAFAQNPELESSFRRLTPGRQRAYLLYFSSAKQSKTRIDRINKYSPKILDNKGMDD